MEKILGVYERDKGSNVWWIRWTDSDHKKHREKVGRKSDAKTLLDKRKTEKLQGIKLPELSGKSLLFSDLLDDALEHSKAENGERSTHELKLKIERLRADWGDRKVHDIAKQQIQRWLTTEKESRDWTDATTNRWQACFSLVFRVAVDNGKIAANPASRIRRKTEDNLSVRFLTLDEEQAITKVLATRHPSYLPAFLISLHTGMRASEQWRLHWSDINFDGRILTVRKLANTKSGRHISLNHVALTALKTLYEMSGPSGPVFLNSKKTPMIAHREWFDPAVAEAKIANYTWHKNRHTFASRLAMAGVDIRTIAQLMGHSTIQMSMRYAHLSPDHNQSAVDRLANFGSNGTPNRTPNRRVLKA
ncbi:integrase [Granulicella aggregans]|uniref:Integrase n=1 Tax=Granulicella aggregans TaxID=474949 RepID=A0A7W8E3E5_9BACT|nr:site-specific integrase [Granulicella aggregans]MBB5056075.1 integrase [Granulicella aggregans]